MSSRKNLLLRALALAPLQPGNPGNHRLVRCRQGVGGTELWGGGATHPGLLPQRLDVPLQCPPLLSGGIQGPLGGRRLRGCLPLRLCGPKPA